MKWREPPDPGRLWVAWESLQSALARLRAELGRAWGHGRMPPASRATRPLLAEPKLLPSHVPGTPAPPARAVCSRCGGSRWWSERPPERVRGWRCSMCFPEPGFPGDVVVVNTRPAAGL